MEQQYKATVSIAGTCILRDTFSRQAEKDGGYKVEKYMSRFSPLSLCEPPIPVNENAFWAFDLKKHSIPDFSKRCIYYDLTRTIMDFLKEAKSDWFIVDAALCRRDYFQFGEEKYSCYGAQQFIFDDMANHHILPPVTNVKTLFDFSEEEIERRMQYYVEQLLTLYPLEQIILLENWNVDLHYDGKRTIQAYNNQAEFERENKNIKYCHQLMKKMLKGCHYIPMPDYVMGDTYHWLGCSPLHYQKEYYDYSFAAIEIINRRLPREQEEAEIAALCAATSQRYLEKYYSVFAKRQMEMAANEPVYKLERDRFYLYVTCMGKLMQTGVPLKKLFQRKHWKRVAFFGWNRLAECFYNTLQNSKIQISYVIEDMTAERQAKLIPGTDSSFLVSRKASTFANVDAIIITDIANEKQVRQVLKGKTNIPVYSAYDLAK